MADFLEINIEDADVLREVQRSIEEVTGKLIKQVAEGFPEETRALMPEGGVSGKGESPHQQSKKLARSLKATPVLPNALEIEVAEHGFYLDPLFKEDGGGQLNRPFIERGIDRSLAKSLSEL